MKGPICLLALLACTITPADCLGQTPQAAKRIPVRFICSCSDPVGHLYATAFRDLLATSPRFVLETGFDKNGGSPPAPPSILVSVVSLDPSHDGSAAALSEAYFVGVATFLSHTVSWCPRDRVAHCAESTLASVDDQVQHLLSLPAVDKVSEGANPPAPPPGFQREDVPSPTVAPTSLGPWQDAVLTGFTNVPVGADCSSSGTANPSYTGNGNYNTENSASCSDVNERQWTISFGGHTFVIVREVMLPGIYGIFVNKDVLRGLTPGAHVLAWGDGREVHVKVGAKSAKYRVEQAQ